jgi:SAM-dependent methyltransferase
MSAAGSQHDLYEQLAGANAAQVNPLAAGLLETLDDPRFGALRDSLLDQAHLFPGAAALELGCGPGLLLEGVTERVGPEGRLVGLDLNPHFIAVAERRAAMLLLENARFVTGDCHRLPFADGEFDAVLAEKLLMHVAPLGQVVAEAARVLSVGGRAVFCDHDPYTAFAAGPEPTITSRVLASAAAVYASPRAARETARACVAAGLYVERVHGYLLVLEDPQLPTAGGVAKVWAEHAALGRAVERDTVQRWLHAVERAAKDGRFMISIPHIITVATRVR